MGMPARILVAEDDLKQAELIGGISSGRGI